MTNEEAIQRLHWLRFQQEIGGMFEQALGLAIEALMDEEPSQASEPNGALREAAEKYRSTKYTPGPAPWTHTPDGIVDAEGAFVVRDYEVSYNDTRSTRDDWKRWANRRSGNYRLILAAPYMLAALREAKRLIDEGLPQFNWGASFLSADTIKMLNDIPVSIETAIAKAEGRDT